MKYFLFIIIFILCLPFSAFTQIIKWWNKIDSTTSYPNSGNWDRPLSYDPDLDVLTLTHRCDSSSTPAIWRGFQIYNTQGPGDSAWEQAFPYFGSFTSNLMPDPPAGTIFKSGSDPIPIAVWTTPAKPNWLQYASDPPGVASFAGKDTLTGGDRFRSDIHAWTSESTIFWSAVVEDAAGTFKELRLYRASDATFFSPPSFVAFDTETTGIHSTNLLGGDAINVGGTNVISFVTIPTDTHGILTMRISSSTNEGVTWTTETIDLADVPGLAGYPIPICHGGSMVLDSLGYPHCVIAFDPDPVWRQSVVAEIYKDAGGWKSKIIAPMSIPNDTNGVPVLSLSRNKQGTVFVVGIEYPDIPNQWGITGRKLTSKNWKSPAIYPNWDHGNPRLASRLRYDGADNYTAFMSTAIASDILGRSYLEGGMEYVNVTPVSVDWTPSAFISPRSGDVIAAIETIGCHVSFRDIGEATGTFSLSLRYNIYDSLSTLLFTSTASVPAAHSDSLITVSFSSLFLPPTIGWYRMEAIVTNALDVNHLNDTLRGSFRVVDPVMQTYTPRWNLVSVPVIPENDSLSSIFPNAYSGTLYRYSSTGGYISGKTLTPGKGYWSKFPNPDTVSFHGEYLSSISVLVENSWNLVGSISVPVTVSSITSASPGMVLSNFFGYNGGYNTVSVLEPGKGYWVRAFSSGYINIMADSLSINQTILPVKIVATSEMPPPPPSESDNIQTVLPKKFSLSQNYPNPFNPVTTIRYELPEDVKVSLKIYDVLGREVCTLVNGIEEAGYKSVEWNANNFASGIYFYRIQAGSYVQTKKLVMIK